MASEAHRDCDALHSTAALKQRLQLLGCAAVVHLQPEKESERDGKRAQVFVIGVGTEMSTMKCEVPGRHTRTQHLSRRWTSRQDSGEGPT
eukprot:scaffold1954_cov268-Pinguiococcus_pyrenoidosus.AAC.204